MSVSQRTRTRTLLVIDDDGPTRRMLVTALSEAGYRCVPAPDAESGLAFAESNGVSGAIVDLCLPGMSGAELAWRLTQTYPGLPVIAVTGYANLWDEDDLRDLGVSVVVTEPFRAADVLAALEGALRTRER